MAGLVRCKQCGALYGSRKSHKNYYLSCYSRTGYVPEMIKKEGCTNKNWRLDELVKIVEEALFNFVYNEEYLNNKMQEEQETGFNREIVEKEIQDLDRKINKIMDLMLDEELQIDIVKNKMVEMNNKKKQLEKMLEENKKPAISKLTIEAAQIVKKSWNKFNIEQRNELLRRLIDVIWIDEDQVEIIWIF